MNFRACLAGLLGEGSVAPFFHLASLQNLRDHPQLPGGPPDGASFILWGGTSNRVNARGGEVPW